MDLDKEKDIKQERQEGVVLITTFEKDKASFIWTALKAAFDHNITLSVTRSERFEVPCEPNHCAIRVKIKVENWTRIQDALDSGAWFRDAHLNYVKASTLFNMDQWSKREESFNVATNNMKMKAHSKAVESLQAYGEVIQRLQDNDQKRTDKIADLEDENEQLRKEITKLKAQLVGLVTTTTTSLPLPSNKQ